MVERALAPYRGRRNPRLVTMRRGGLLDDVTHRVLALWAADCAHHVLEHLTAARPADDRPARAVEAARQWARGEATLTDAREAAHAAHAAALGATGAASDAARAAGHAAATGHMADELGPAFYALQAVVRASLATPPPWRARQWQI